ncbi:1,4-dihydroxy-2-naphthoate octaprenyltransferase [Bacterioplanes sanyensis]|nr:1,4-dihydroxy-2-naphthoate octaprenyltransferase [Bacterioplanes sanyensis]
MRPKTLPAAIAPITLGQVLAWVNAPADTFDVRLMSAIFACALLLQIAVNFANDVFDFRAGVDGEQRVGPKRAVAQGWLTASQLFLGLAFVLMLAIAAGSYLIWHGGAVFAWLGVASVVALLAYSGGPLPLASNALGEVTVFVFFGLVAVAGGYHLHHEFIPLLVWVSALQMGCLTAAIMLVNNLRDLDNDKAASKHTLAVRLGPMRSEGLYRWLLLVPLALQWLVVETQMPDTQLSLAQRLLSTSLWVLVLFGSVRLSYLIALRKQHALNQQLAQTAALTLLFAIAASAEWGLRSAV